MRQTLRRAARIGGTLLVVGVIVLVAVLAAPGVVGAEASFVVLSGSMAPAIQAGDVVIVDDVPADEIETGDVITYRTDGEFGDRETNRVTHRVVDVERSEGDIDFETKGDANEEPDPSLVQPSQVVGTVWFHIPAVGKAVLFAQQPWVQGLLLLGPGLLLMGGGMKTLYDATVSEESVSDGDASGANGGDAAEDAADDGTSRSE